MLMQQEYVERKQRKNKRAEQLTMNGKVKRTPREPAPPAALPQRPGRRRTPPPRALGVAAVRAA